MQQVYENTVRFAETDAQGVVFYGNYVTYQDTTVTEFLAAAGYPYEDFVAAEWDIQVVNVDLTYHGSATFRDDLVHALRVDAIGDSSIEYDYQARLATDDALLAEGGVTHVAVDADGEPVRVPSAFRDAVVAFQETPPDPV